tara:strand:- start:52 stop:732 length:681 start_codon:yes stop_codon:yes gene_type:complete
MYKIFLIGLFWVSSFVNANQTYFPDYFFVSLGEKQDSYGTITNTSFQTTTSAAGPFLQICSANPYDLSQDIYESVCSIKKSNSISLIGAGFKIGSIILELSYSDLGASAPNYIIIPTFTANPSIFSYNYEYSSFQINSIAYKNFSNKIQGYAKYGISYLQNDLKNSINPQNLPTNYQLLEERIELIYGLGINFDYFDSVNFFIEFMDSGHSIPSSYSLGIKYFLNK